MKIEDLRKRMLEASHSVQKLTENYVNNHLPSDYIFVVSVGSTRQSIESIEQAVSFENALEEVWGNGLVSTWVDMAAVFIKDGMLYISLTLSGNRTNNDNKMVWKDSSIAPFRCKSPTLPIDWQTGAPKFDLNRTREFL